MKQLSILLFGLLLIPTNTYTSPIEYFGKGETVYFIPGPNNEQSIEISIWFVVSDQITSEEPEGSYGNIFVHYPIESFKVITENGDTYASTEGNTGMNLFSFEFGVNNDQTWEGAGRYLFLQFGGGPEGSMLYQSNFFDENGMTYPSQGSDFWHNNVLFSLPHQIEITTADHASTLSLSRIEPVPEPATLILLGSGLLGFAGFRKKLKR